MCRSARWRGADGEMNGLPGMSGVVAAALAEDLGADARVFAPDAAPDPGILDRDVTTTAVLPAGAVFRGRVAAREDGVVCGLPVLAEVYAVLARAAGIPDAVEVFPLVAEGAAVGAGEAVAEVEGDARVVLAGERTALDLVMTLSGIATESRRWAEAAAGRLTVTDTRKTPPGLRELAKYAVRVGGASNHRMGLYDMVLVKDNHLRRAGGVAEAVRAAKRACPGLPVEAEADSVEQAAEAAAAGADIVLLDNMDDPTLAEAVTAVRAAAARAGRTVLTEASGGVALPRMEALVAAGVDRVSTSALTLARPLDFGFDEVDVV